ncbi:MAG TPA: anti-sigma regulatory factor [Jatrophihabitantaceae bacterium]|nr:anti-sigma regulatory factor [Jatrophihabitantaceae bacterium]
MSGSPEHASSDPAAQLGSGEVELRVPADSAYIAVLRSVAAGLAARCDLTLDEIEDLRIAVDEACALLLGPAAVGSFLTTGFVLSPGSLVVTSSVPAPPGFEPDRTGFGWTVLAALSTAVDLRNADGELSITLTKNRGDAAR